MMRYLDEMDALGLSFYFQFTVVNYPRDLDPKTPSLDRSLEAFKKLSDRLGKHRVVWRYDPVILTDKLSSEWHIENFTRIAAEIGTFTERLVLSVVDPYLKTRRRMNHVADEIYFDLPIYAPVLKELIAVARGYGIDQIMSCAEPALDMPGIEPGRCVDGDLLARIEEERCSMKKNTFALSNELPEPKRIPRKLHGQRAGCLCHRSVDIGVNNTCGFGCAYCYANDNHREALTALRRHKPSWNSLIDQFQEDAMT